MDSSSDNDKDVLVAGPAQAEGTQAPDATRRRFARNAVIGSAVILSLGNRATWSQDIVGPCISNSIWDSFVMGNNMISAHPGHDDDPNVEPGCDAECIVNEIYSKGAQDGFDIARGDKETCVVTAPPEPLSFGSDRSLRQRDRFRSE